MQKINVHKKCTLTPEGEGEKPVSFLFIVSEISIFMCDCNVSKRKYDITYIRLHCNKDNLINQEDD